MSKKDILKTGEYMPIEVGSWVYVWTLGGQKPPTDRSRACMISAHGEQTLITSGSGAPKHVNLAYYCPNGYNLNGAHLLSSATRQMKVNEWFSPGQAKQDYKLTKYQGSHNNSGENYEKIQTGIHRPAQVKRFNDMFHDNKRPNHKSEQQWERERQTELDGIKDVVYDIVTIRDRSIIHGSSPTLYSVVAALEKAGFHYSTVHCFFCRGSSDPKRDLGSHKAERRNK
ncbi:hypothetical protein VT84_23820 [Gemmata sp. SH-PL17]|uniref:putative adhesin n=1 Tax=Gemmata sp. SH-PL17 TaxID=1630693 RepID=UPI00078D70C3|nr:hypothetical protein [Gemmata sp. SH-PL17]AMV27449.1 hypothetical protein VT84_23820 [Gemmata sp. SH-PL17]